MSSSTSERNTGDGVFSSRSTVSLWVMSGWSATWTRIGSSLLPTRFSPSRPNHVRIGRLENRDGGHVEQSTHREWMRLALAEAQQAPPTRDVPVGAIVVNGEGVVIAARRNERELTGDPTAHAEILALRDAAEVIGDWRLTDCTLVVTLEPCVMCAGAIVSARVGTLVFGAWDEKAGAAGSLYDVVRDRRLNHRVEVFPGVEAEASARLLLEFFEDPLRRP